MRISSSCPLTRVAVDLKHDKVHAADCEECETREGKIDRIDRVITLEGDLDADQRAKLLEIANKCPVHRTLHSEVWVATTLAGVERINARLPFVLSVARRHSRRTNGALASLRGRP